MVDVVISIAAKVAELLVGPIGKHICYPFKYKSNIEELKRKVEKLKDQRESVQHRIDEARGQGNEIEKSVEKWMNSVDEFTDGVVKPLIDVEDNANKRCFKGLCVNLMITRYSLSKKAVKMTKDGINLLEDGKFDKVSNLPAFGRTTSIYIEGYRDFDSRKPLFNDLMEALKNPDANLIGVYGMGGVGKTTLVKRVADQAGKDNLFDVVVIVELTETPNIKNIQGRIAEVIGLSPLSNEETIEGRAARLRRRLRKEKRVLIVLDNIWSKLNLHAVGILICEEGNGSNLREEDQKERNNHQRQCKVLLTSRNADVLTDHMNTTKNILVESLEEQEAGDLFWKIVGDSAKNVDLEPIGVEIVKCCAGLPVAITTIAKALKNKSPYYWKDALDQLRRSPRHIKGMDANVYSPIKLSYDFLESKEEKSLFLLCSLFIESRGWGIFIENLLRYGMGLCLFENVVTLEQGRNRLYMLINKLKASSLLLDGYSNKFVKMHDIIHAVAVSIASTDELMFNIPDDTDVKEMLEEKLSKDSIAVSLLYRNVSMLPERLEFRKLKLFVLLMDELSLEISDVFFEGMKELKVLDLTKIQMSSLPQSLCGLINLQTLCLHCCQLGNIIIIGELKTLEILSLWGSDIEQLPKEIGQLTRLRLLELRACSNLKVISPNVIPSLTRLEELYMGDGNGFFQWENDGQSNAKLSDLKHLSRLTTLEIQVLDARIIPQDLFFEKLGRYKILVGGVWEWFDDRESSRMMKLKLDNPIYLGEGVKGLLNRTEDLYLDELKGFKNILYQLNGEGFPQLKNLHVQNGPEMQYVINSIEWGLGIGFPRLESLVLHNLINLEKICHGQLSKGSFSKLRILQVRKCDRLNHLFSFSVANNLFQLQEIELTDCKKLEEIIKESAEPVHQNENVRRIQFTQLHTLTLKRLPRLTSFVLYAFMPDIGSQEIVAEDEGFMPHFSQNVVLPSLKNLKLFSINVQCKWLDQLPVMTSCCQALTNLMLEKCNGLRFLFSYSMVKSLALLQKLEIWNCQLIEEIINTKALRAKEKMIEMVFPKLISLHLKGLPELTRFGYGNLVEFPSLTELSIDECPKLKTLFSASTSSNMIQNKEVIESNYQDDIFPLFEGKVVLPTLASLNLSSVRIQTIWHDQLQAMSFSYFENLTKMIIDGCDTLKFVFSSSMVPSLIQLTNLEITNCKLMECVIITRGERISNTVFPKLYRLHLSHLPKLTSFCTFAGIVGLPSLARLWLINCPKMLTFVSEFPQTDMPESNEDLSQIPPLFDEKVQIPELKFLHIGKVDNLRKIWHHQLALDSFSKLDSVELFKCRNLLSVFPSNMLGRLQKLEEFVVEECDSLETIFEISSCMVEADPARIVFPQLTWLDLSCLPSLTSFYPGSHISEWPKLKSLQVLMCDKIGILTLDFSSLQETHRENQLQNSIEGPLFVVDKVVLPSLKNLKLFLITIQCKWLDQLPVMISCCQALTNLMLEKCNGLRFLFSYSMVKSLALLQKLEIRNCQLIEEIINTEALRAQEKMIEMVFPKLISLHLKGLPELTRFSSGNLVEFPSLTELSIEECPKLKTLFSASMSSNMKQNKEVVESNCQDDIFPLFEIMVVLSTLASLNLSSIRIQTIWHDQLQAVSSSYFENLSKMIIDGCDTLKFVFSFSMVPSLIQLTNLEITKCKLMESVIISRGEKISNTVFPKLYRLHLEHLPELMSFCTFAGTVGLPSLAQLWLHNCPKMLTFVSEFPKTDMPESNEDLSQIPPLFDEKVQIPELRFLHIEKVDTVRKIWHHQLAMDSFSKMDSVELSDCYNLLSVFPSNMLGRLQKLEEFVVGECDSLETIFEISSCTVEADLARIVFPQLTQFVVEECDSLETIFEISSCMVEADPARIVFPQLTQLDLSCLPSLTSFYPGSHILEWPKLKFLGICLCREFEIRTSDFLSLQDPHRENQLQNSIRRPLFVVDKVGFPKIEQLALEWNWIVKDTLHGKFSEYYLSNLKFLELTGVSNQSGICPCCFLYTLPNLERLEVCDSSFSEIFTFEGLDCKEAHVEPPGKLSQLTLYGLTDSLHLLEENSLLSKVFQRLTTLEVLGCNGLVTLMEGTVAKSLGQLRRLKISDCEMIEEIIAYRGGEVEDWIIFDQLEYLELDSLPKLTSFCSGRYIFEFQSLQVVVRQCPNMKMFPLGVLF